MRKLYPSERDYYLLKIKEIINPSYMIPYKYGILRIPRLPSVVGPADGPL